MPTRSRASGHGFVGQPTMLKAGRPGATCTWTSTGRILDAFERHRGNTLDHVSPGLARFRRAPQHVELLCRAQEHFRGTNRKTAYFRAICGVRLRPPTVHAGWRRECRPAERGAPSTARARVKAPTMGPIAASALRRRVAFRAPDRPGDRLRQNVDERLQPFGEGGADDFAAAQAASLPSAAKAQPWPGSSRWRGGAIVLAESRERATGISFGRRRTNFPPHAPSSACSPARRGRPSRRSGSRRSRRE